MTDNTTIVAKKITKQTSTKPTASTASQAKQTQPASQPPPRQTTSQMESPSSDISPMKAGISNQIERVKQIISNAQVFKENYTELTENIISSINSQLKSYNRNSRKAIMIDIYDMVTEAINWDDLQQSLTSKMKSKTTNVQPSTWTPMPPLNVSKLPTCDDDAIVNMFINCDEVTAKEFSSFRKLATAELNDILTNVDDFETSLINYRTTCVKLILSKNIQPLFDIHFNYVNDLFHKRKSIPTTITINGKQVTLIKSQREFITNALKTLITP